MKVLQAKRTQPKQGGASGEHTKRTPRTSQVNEYREETKEDSTSQLLTFIPNNSALSSHGRK